MIDRYDVEHKLVPSAGTPARLRYTYWLHFAEGSAMSPLLGEHTDEVLEQLGYSAEYIDELRAEKVI